MNINVSSMSHNACSVIHKRYNYIIEWYQKPEFNGTSVFRLVDSYVDYTADGALSQFRNKHYVNPVVVSVYRHSPCEQEIDYV